MRGRRVTSRFVTVSKIEGGSGASEGKGGGGGREASFRALDRRRVPAYEAIYDNGRRGNHGDPSPHSVTPCMCRVEPRASGTGVRGPPYSARSSVLRGPSSTYTARIHAGATFIPQASHTLPVVTASWSRGRHHRVAAYLRSRYLFFVFLFYFFNSQNYLFCYWIAHYFFILFFLLLF